MIVARKRQRADWGTITKVGANKWRLRYWANGADGYKRRSKTVYGTRKDAGDALAALRVEHSQDAPVPTVGMCWARWYLPDAQRRVDDGELARQSLERYQSTWRAHIEPRWASTPVDQVRPLAVQQWILTLKRNAANNCIQLMRQIIEYSVKFEHIPSNPMNVKYSLPARSTTNTQEDGVWSPDELVEVWRACANTPLEAVVLLCGFGSCRVGEALGARSSDVTRKDVDGMIVACVRIDSQIDARGREVDATKNKWSTRTIVIAGNPAIRLLEIAAEKDGYLAEDERGGSMTQDYARIAFKSLLTVAGAPIHTLRALRSTWATIARWTLRIPSWHIEPMMGHVGDGVTGRHYDRPEEDEFAAVLADAWREHWFV